MSDDGLVSDDGLGVLFTVIISDDVDSRPFAKDRPSSAYGFTDPEGSRVGAPFCSKSDRSESCEQSRATSFKDRRGGIRARASFSRTDSRDCEGDREEIRWGGFSIMPSRSPTEVSSGLPAPRRDPGSVSADRHMTPQSPPEELLAIFSPFSGTRTSLPTDIGAILELTLVLDGKLGIQESRLLNHDSVMHSVCNTRLHFRHSL
mmetsp:Transcript_38673/g.98870  ORF Transcript_38673/g.98870 Transcript_38673/m.98870 type:complete len:204 (+) Transcript_38673:328-939(+)